MKFKPFNGVPAATELLTVMGAVCAPCLPDGRGRSELAGDGVMGVLNG